MKKNQISENEMVEFINANINSVPNRSKEKFTTYDIKTQYNKIKWYLKVQEMKNSEKNENVIVARLRRIFEVKNADVEDVKSVIEFCNNYMEEIKQKQLSDIEKEIERLTNLKNQLSK